MNSEKDPAGSNIHESLLARCSFKETEDRFEDNPIFSSGGGIFLATSKNEIVFVDDLDKVFFGEALSYVFVSRHRAESGIPSLTAHFTGNFRSNDFGGFPGELAFCDPAMLKNYLLELNGMRSQILPKFNITLEATHHGPTSLRRPVLFVELGSGPVEWVEKKPADVIADALVSSFYRSASYTKVAVGLGGMHYSEKFNKLVLTSDIALGHIIPKYALENLDKPMLRQVIDKSVLPVNIAALDWKGLGKHKQEIIEMIEAEGLEILKL